MITFYENNPQNQMRYHQRKPDELSFLSDDEEDTNIGFSKNKRMSQLTATDSAYFSESSNQTTLINPKNSPSPSPHHNVILWQKQQQHYQKQNNSVPSPSITPTQSFDNGNDITSITQSDTIPHIEDWETPSSDNNSIKSPVNKINQLSNKDLHELSYNSPEQRTQRIQQRMNQWKEKLELMSSSSAVSSSSSVVGGYSPTSGISSPNLNLNRSYRRHKNRHASFSSTVDVFNGFDQPFSSSRSIYSVNSLPNSVFDEKYDSFADDDRESVLSLRSSNFHSNFNSNPNAYIPPRSKSSMEVRHPQRSIFGTNSNSSSPLKESRIHIMQAELENTQKVYKQKLKQINQMKQDLEQYQYKLEEMREKEIEQARQEAIEELENSVIKNLNLEIEALRNKLQETTRELEHSKAYSDMLRNELITLKMNEQSFSVEKMDEDEKYKNEEINDNPVDYNHNEKTKTKDISTINENNVVEMQTQTKSLELQRLEMLEKELKKKNEEIFELKKKLDKSTKLNELSKREIDLLNRKVENHKQAREDIEKRHTKLVDVASANEIELNKLRHKLDVLSQRQDKALRKMKKRYSSILEVNEDRQEEQEEETIKVEDNNLNYEIQPKSNLHRRSSKIEPIHHETEKEESTIFDKETLSESRISFESETLDPNKNIDINNQNETDTSLEITNLLEQTSIIDNTIDDLIDLSDFEKELSDSSNGNSDNLDEILNQLNLSDLENDEDFDLEDISFDNETLLI